MPKVTLCPTCQRPVEWSLASPWRPFCSERCKLIDLGAWVSGQRAIPGDEGLGVSDGNPEERSDDGDKTH